MPSVLVVDDDRDLRENVEEILARAGFEVAAVGGAQEAFALLEHRRFDVVLLDLMMPGMGGMEALPLIRRRAPRTQVVMVTAFATVQSAVEAMRLGAEDYLVKPFRVDELTVAVRRCLESARFAACEPAADAESAFHCLANAIRRDILRLLGSRGSVRFMDITRHLGIEDHTKVNFHLRILREARLVTQEGGKAYTLTPQGVQVAGCVQQLLQPPG
ncbi:MAG: response regulator [Thermodesulfobacteriota bacterium]|jgi:DNA-binding response OmpR family regulator